MINIVESSRILLIEVTHINLPLPPTSYDYSDHTCWELPRTEELQAAQQNFSQDLLNPEFEQILDSQVRHIVQAHSKRELTR